MADRSKPSVGDVFAINGQWYLRVEEGAIKITDQQAAQARTTRENEQKPRLTSQPELKNSRAAGQFVERPVDYTISSENIRSSRPNAQVAEPRLASSSQKIEDPSSRHAGQAVSGSGDARTGRRAPPPVATDEPLSSTLGNLQITDRVQVEGARTSKASTYGPRTSQPELTYGSQRGPEPLEATSEENQFTVLKDTMVYFAQIPEGDHKQRGDFLMENPELLRFNITHLYQEAANQIQAGDYQLARQCISCLVTIRLCENLRNHPRRIQDRISTLYDTRTERYKEYREMFATVEEDVRVFAAKQDAQSRAGQPVKPNPRERLSTNPEVSGSKTTSNVKQSYSVKPGYNDNARDSRHQKLDAPERAQGNEQIGRMERTLASKQVEADILENLSQLIGRAPDPIKIAAEDLEVSETQQLSSSYRVRENAATFFIPGRVFSILWHEPAGQSLKTSQTLKELAKPADGYMQARLNRNTTVGVMGQTVFSHIRRMIVVRSRPAYCWCISIGTYGGQGLKKRGLKQRDRDAHAIVYDSLSKSQYLPNEPETSKKSIAIKLKPGQSLSRASRVHYGKPSTVEYNTPVQDVGMVIKEHLHVLLSDVRNEMMDD